MAKDGMQLEVFIPILVSHMLHVFMCCNIQGLQTVFLLRCHWWLLATIKRPGGVTVTMHSSSWSSHSISCHRSQPGKNSCNLALLSFLNFHLWYQLDNCKGYARINSTFRCLFKRIGGPILVAIYHTSDLMIFRYCFLVVLGFEFGMLTSSISCFMISFRLE